MAKKRSITDLAVMAAAEGASAGGKKKSKKAKSCGDMSYARRLTREFAELRKLVNSAAGQSGASRVAGPAKRRRK